MYFSNKYKYKFCCLKLFLELLQAIEQLAAIGSGRKSEMNPSSKRCEVILYDKKGPQKHIHKAKTLATSGYSPSSCVDAKVHTIDAMFFF